MGKELIGISEELAEAQIKSYFDYYSEDMKEVEAFQIAAGGVGFNNVIKKLTRLIMKGIVSIDVGPNGVEIVQQLFHNKSIEKLCYAALNGEASIAISDLDGVMKRNTLLGKLSGVGADGIKSLIGQDHKTAGTIYAFLSLL